MQVRDEIEFTDVAFKQALMLMNTRQLGLLKKRLARIGVAERVAIGSSALHQSCQGSGPSLQRRR